MKLRGGKSARTGRVLSLVFFITLATLNLAYAQVCEAPFKRPFYPTRQAFCSVGELVKDAYDPSKLYACEQMEVDHLVSLSFAYRSGLCDANQLRRLANDPRNLRLTYWKTNRSKAAKSAEEFALGLRSARTAEKVLEDAASIRRDYRLPPVSNAHFLRIARQEIKKSRRDAEILRNRMVTYKGSRMKAAQAVSHHASRASRRVTLSSLRNVGAMAGEALPFVGVAVVAGVTALEVRDACETLKDIHELNVAFNPDAAPSEDVKTVCTIEVPTREELMATVSQTPEKAWESAKASVSTLPNIEDIEIDWRSYFNATKKGAVWIVDRTGENFSDVMAALMDTWASVQLPKWPWSSLKD